MKYWLNIVSEDHVRRGEAGGFTQANHGKPYMLKKMARGNWLVFYSRKKEVASAEKLQAFTALGRISDDEPYQAEMSPDFHPFRRNVDFKKSHNAPIRPLIDELDFITDKTHWGYKFRFGVIEISEADFRKIAAAMGVGV